ncbi:MAG: hypothetical protein JNL01_11935 [Bdellovibrionales bacterium]|nr:hypothetical protein [Bdellovibrionales bacterium]
MDHRLEASVLRNMAQEIITPSQQFEPFVPGQNMSATEKLTVLGHLEPLTAEKLTAAREDQKRAELAKALIEEKKRRDAQVRTQPKVTAPAQTHFAPRATSRQPTYQKALNNPEVVDALLQLSRKAQAPSRARPVARPFTTATPRTLNSGRPGSIIKKTD